MLDLVMLAASVVVIGVPLDSLRRARDDRSTSLALISVAVLSAAFIFVGLVVNTISDHTTPANAVGSVACLVGVVIEGKAQRLRRATKKKAA